MHASKVYTKLQERLGLADHLMVMNVMLAKIATNLKVFGASEPVIEQTLNLFQVRHPGFPVPPLQVVRHLGSDVRTLQQDKGVRCGEKGWFVLGDVCMHALQSLCMQHRVHDTQQQPCASTATPYDCRRPLLHLHAPATPHSKGLLDGHPNL